LRLIAVISAVAALGCALDRRGIGSRTLAGDVGALADAGVSMDARPALDARIPSGDAASAADGGEGLADAGVSMDARPALDARIPSGDAASAADGGEGLADASATDAGRADAGIDAGTSCRPHGEPCSEDTPCGSDKLCIRGCCRPIIKIKIP
jgi:hypothetical protein